MSDIMSSEAFQRWFGQSKVADEAGQPLVVYHGTRTPGIDALRPSTGGEFGPGIYLTANEGTANFYAHHVARGPGEPIILKLYASIQNPFHVTKLEWIKLTERSTPRTVQARLMRRGHDGIFGVGLSGHDVQIVAFEPTQVKAVENRGTWDAADPSMFGEAMSDIKVDGWLKRFMKLKEDQLRAVGVASFDALGCGHYGCVLPHVDPHWVVKVTRDPTEGPIAAKVTELRSSGAASLKGIVLFKEVYKADETIDWRGKTWPVYVTVRESIKPFTWQDANKMRRHRVSHPRPTAPSSWAYSPYTSVTALAAMKEAALKWHEANDTIREAERIGTSVSSRAQAKLDAAYDDYVEWAQKVGDEFPYIGETLFELIDEGIVLRDVHAMNLGYTTWELEESSWIYRSAGTVVIHDLGHTPTEPGEAQFLPLGEE